MVLCDLPDNGLLLWRVSIHNLYWLVIFEVVEDWQQRRGLHARGYRMRMFCPALVSRGEELRPRLGRSHATRILGVPSAGRGKAGRQHVVDLPRVICVNIEGVNRV